MNKPRYLYLLLIVLLSLLIVSCSCNQNKEPSYTVKRFSFYSYLDTNSTITLEYDQNIISDTEMSEKMKEVENILYDIETTFSPEPTVRMALKGETESILMKVNANAGKRVDGELVKTKVNDDFILILENSLMVSVDLNGSFDPSIGPLTSLWDIPNQVGKDESQIKIPTKSEINEAKDLVDYHNIIIDKENKEVALSITGMKLDFGAIAKGYACDKVLNFVKNIESVSIILVDLGGNIYSYGESPNGIKTDIAIRNPFYTTSDNSNIYTLMNINKNYLSVVTSGIYERYITKNNVTYHHLLNPITGYPFDNEIESVSIFGTSSMMCDAIATGIYGLGLDEGIAYIQNNPDYEAIFITKDQRVFLVGNFDYTINQYISGFEFNKM